MIFGSLEFLMRNNFRSERNMLLVLCNENEIIFFVSNSLQEVIIHVDFFAALSTDHSPVTIWISKNKNCIHAHGFWQFNSYLLSDQNYARKNLIQTFHSNQNVIPNAQIKWELLKYEIQKFTIKY